MQPKALNMIVRIGIAALAICLSSASFAQTKEQEANLKAVFIYNFTKYIEWDTASGSDEFLIGVIGSSPVTAALEEIATTKRVNNKRIIVRVFKKPEDMSYCQVLFIPGDIPFSLESILSRVEKGTLTVSEEEGYGRLGTAFNFFISKDKLKFEANLKAIYAAGLKAGSQLLKLATIVD